mgnify:FL=1
MFDQYHRAREHFIENSHQLIAIEKYLMLVINNLIQNRYDDMERDYNEASYLHAFWANYPPEDRGRAPVGDQIPWIEVGEQAIGHQLSRRLAYEFPVVEIGLPSGADNRFVLYSDEIADITHGLTRCAFVFLDIKSVGPRDDFDHIVLSPYQVSGDGLWAHPNQNMTHSAMDVVGARARHTFFPAIAPIYAFSNGEIAPTVHLFVKPIYRMLSVPHQGQPLKSIVTVCVPNGLLLTTNPNYLQRYPQLFFPGKDDKTKDPRKIRVRVSFRLLNCIAPWRVGIIEKS